MNPATTILTWIVIALFVAVVFSAYSTDREFKIIKERLDNIEAAK